MTSINRVHDFVSSLSATERRELETRLAHDKVVVANVTTLSPDEVLFWDTMCEALSNMHLTAPGFGARDNMINSKGGIGRVKFAECSTALNDYVTHACTARLDRTHKRAIYIEVLSCLIKWMRRRHYDKAGDAYYIPLSPATICAEIGGLPISVERCYPGYVKARLLHMVVPREVDQGRLRTA